MKNRFLVIVYIFLFFFLAVSAITRYAEKGLPVILMSLAMGALYLLPAILERLLHIIIPPLLKYMILTFLFLCLQIGGILSFYDRFDGWDSFIHLVSGFLTPALALSVISIFNRNSLFLKTLSPGFILVFMVFFASGVSLLWEYIEFFTDTLLGTNHLNDTLLDNGQVDIGLIDTMTDLLLSQSASFISAFCLYRAIKKDRWLSISRILITRENHQAN
ncbi:MAG: hypothetical protein GXX04_08135 [Clostridiaceae bacterium]|nr:hypothetical protein [Clostridiaceae bacterium]